MGSHLCRLLAARDCDVVCTTRRRHATTDGVSYMVGDAKKSAFLDEALSEHWDALVDFMVWSTDEFRGRWEAFLSSTDQYVFVSSYRVYAGSFVITENSPRLLDKVNDATYLATDEYALCKARCENLLFGSELRNWTIVRPAVTYDGASGRLQLGVFESDEWLWRAERGVPVPMPRDMLDVQATMSYGGDVARMIASLVGSPSALGETFTVSGSDHMTWREVCEAYASVLPFEVVECATEGFIAARGGEYQLRYDRLLNRVVDNSKVLQATGIEASSLVGMKEGLARELKAYLASDRTLCLKPGQQGGFDKLCGGVPALKHVVHDSGLVGAAKYLVRRWL